MSEQHLLGFLLQVVVLVTVARAGGELAIRVGIAPVVGELASGIGLGPSLLGRLWPAGYAGLFPSDASQRAVLEVFAWVGVMFLVLIAGVETRLEVVRKAGRAAIAVWIGGFLVPFTLGLGLGWAVPGRLMAPGVQRPVFALFVATALSISAVPVIVRILMDLGLSGTRVGTVIVSAAVADDAVGWILLGVVSALAAGDRLDGHAVALALVGIGLFAVLALTVGRRLVSRALAGAGRLESPFSETTIILAIVFVGGAVTQAIHVHLVLGVFVAGVLIARAAGTGVESEAIESIRRVGMAFFIPFFFSYSGTRVDLSTLDGSTVLVAAGAVLVACVGKLAGGGLGAAAGGLGRWESLAVGAGLNARGAMELVIAGIGLSIGILTPAMYAIFVLIAVVTTLMAAPLLRHCLARASSGGDPDPDPEPEPEPETVHS